MYLLDNESEAQRSPVICPTPHCRTCGETTFEPTYSGYRALALFYGFCETILEEGKIDTRHGKNRACH